MMRENRGFRILGAAALMAILLTGCGYAAQPQMKPIIIEEPDIVVGDEDYDLLERQTPEDGHEPLTAHELAAFQDWADGGTYGFLHSVFDRPEDADYQEVLYAGADIPYVENTREHYDEYVRISGDTEPNYDLIVLKKEDVDAFLQLHAGISSEDIGMDYADLGMYYSERTDCFYRMISDTNAGSFFECVDGYRDRDLYKVHFVKNENGCSFYPNDVEATFRKAGEVYQIISIRSLDNWEPEHTVEVEPVINRMEEPDGSYILEIRSGEDVSTSYCDAEGTVLYREYSDLQGPRYQVWCVYDGYTRICHMIYAVSEDELSVYKDYDATGTLTYYGDKVRVHIQKADGYVKLIDPNAELTWEDCGEAVITLSEACTDLEPYEAAQTAADYMPNLIKMCGRRVGDVVEVIDEGTGGGSIYRRFQILEIMR